MDLTLFGVPIIQAAFLGFPFVVALLLGLLLPVAVILTASAASRVSASTRLSIIVGSLVAGSTFAIALSGRMLTSVNELATNPGLGGLAESQATLGIRSSQIFTLCALLVASAEIFRWVTRRTKMPKPVLVVWFSLVMYNLIAVGLSGVLGNYRNPELKDIYFLIVVTAVALTAGEVGPLFWRNVRWMLLLPSLGSLLAIAAKPSLVLLNDYTSWVPGLTQRLYGLSDHANSIGIVAAMALCIELSNAVRSRPSLLFLLIHGAVLFLAQSKTAWLAAMIVLPLVRWHWIKSVVFGGDAWHARIYMLLAGVFAGVIGVSVLVALSTSTGVDRALEGAGAYTLTGRTRLWQATLEEFYRSPILGYGPSLWDVKFRMERGFLFAGQAHNQFVQILGQAGLLGLFSMLAYLGSLVWLLFKGRASEFGLALALFLLLLIRCLTESPLRMNGIMGWENVLHLLVFAAVANCMRSTSVEVPNAYGILIPQTARSNMSPLRQGSQPGESQGNRF